MINGWRAAVLFAALTGGAAMADPQDQQPGTGGSGTYDATTYDNNVAYRHDSTNAYPTTLSLIGGVEGYSGAVGSQVSPGAAYGVVLGYEPFQFLGSEIGYSGGFNYLRGNNFSSTGSGPDLIRNGGYFALTPGVTLGLNPTNTTSLKPYVLGGIGFDAYSMRNNAQAAGFQSKTVGDVPFGAGLELRLNKFVANARFNYNWDFGNQFASVDSNPFRYQGQLSLGGAF